MSYEQRALQSENTSQSIDSGIETNECNTDSNNNEHACSRQTGVSSPVLTSPSSSDDPLMILSRGPSYLRTRIFQRQSGFERPVTHRSAAESLQESRRQFLRSESEPSRVMSLTTSPMNVRTHISEELSSESGLVESMVTKLHIPKTEPNDSDITAPSGFQPLNPSNTSRTVMGKRRMCSKADDPYGGQTQRQRLGSVETAGVTEATVDAPDVDACDTSGLSDNFMKLDHQFLMPSTCGCDPWKTPDKTASNFNHIQPNVGQHPWTEFSPDPGRGESSKFGGNHHHCDGAMCQGDGKDTEALEYKMEGEDGDQKNVFNTGYFGGEKMLGSGTREWRKCRGETRADVDQRFSLGNERTDDGKGARLLRRYKKVVSKTGSRSDLMNRLSNSSEQANLAARNSAEFDAFFSEMGMDRSAIESALNETPMDHAMSTASLNVFENISSIGTPLDNRSCTSRDSQAMDESKPLDLEDQPGLGMSIVERNARVIRWLCNIRRVSTLTDDGEV